MTFFAAAESSWWQHRGLEPAPSLLLRLKRPPGIWRLDEDTFRLLSPKVAPTIAPPMHQIILSYDNIHYDPFTYEENQYLIWTWNKLIVRYCKKCSFNNIFLILFEVWTWWLFLQVFSTPCGLDDHVVEADGGEGPLGVGGILWRDKHFKDLPALLLISARADETFVRRGWRTSWL